MPFLLAAGFAHADAGADLADVGARIAYGFYAAQPDVVAAAQRDLEKLPTTDPRVNYTRALAALRTAQLDVARGRPIGRPLASCIEWAGHAAEQNPASAEPWILVAACSALGARTEPVRALLHGRRFDQAIARARSIEPGNPRLALVEVWRHVDRSRADPELDVVLTAQLETAIGTFRTRAAKFAAADWGEAETLALLGAVYLERGDVRASRDLVEQALLAAPAYEYALKLRRKIQIAGSAESIG